MWNNSLRELWNISLRSMWNEIRLFTFAKQIFHSGAISLGEAKFHSPQANFAEKSTCFCKCFFLAPPTGLEPVTPWLTVRCSTDWAKEDYKIKQTIPDTLISSAFCVSIELSSRLVSKQVLLPLQSLTSVFGMGTGGPFAFETLTLWSRLSASLYHVENPNKRKCRMKLK